MSVITVKRVIQRARNQTSRMRRSFGGLAANRCLAFPRACATDDYRRQQGVMEPLQWIDWTGVFWQRTV
jgi:Macrocin-O-methyltransferase (TylF)